MILYTHCNYYLLWVWLKRYEIGRDSNEYMHVCSTDQFIIQLLLLSYSLLLFIKSVI